MSSSYPSSLDNFSTSHADGAGEIIHASTVNDLADAVNKIEAELGTNPSSSSYSTVASRLSAMTFGVFNVFDHGAVGDGVTDDTLAIQAAIDAASTAASGAKVIYLNNCQNRQYMYYRLVTSSNTNITYRGEAYSFQSDVG